MIKIPVRRLRTFALALFAILVAMRVHNKVDSTHKVKINQFGVPPITKWLSELVNGVNVIMNTLIPIAVLS